MSHRSWARHGHVLNTSPVLLKSAFPFRLLRPIINNKPIRLLYRPAKLGPSCSTERTRFGRRENRECKKRMRNARRAPVYAPRGIMKVRTGDLGGCGKISTNQLSPKNALERGSEMKTPTRPRRNPSLQHGLTCALRQNLLPPGRPKRQIYLAKIYPLSMYLPFVVAVALVLLLPLLHRPLRRSPLAFRLLSA